MVKPIRMSLSSKELKDEALHKYYRKLYLLESQKSKKLEKGLKIGGELKNKIQKTKNKINSLRSNPEVPKKNLSQSETKSTTKNPRKFDQASLKRRREKKLQALGKDEVEYNTLNWEMLPSGEWNHFQGVLKDLVNQRKRDAVDIVKVAKERYRRIFELKPTKVYQGYRSFSNYFAFHFNDTKKVVLESMIYSNAIYIIEGDWKTLSRKTKKELKEIYKAEVINHSRGWFSKLKNSLQIGFE